MANIIVHNIVRTKRRKVTKRAECKYYCLYLKGLPYDSQCLKPFYICTNYKDAEYIMQKLVAEYEDTANENTFNKFMYENVISDYYFVDA